jgi:hypothetical protein
MILTGLHLAQLAGLFGLAGSAVVALYILRLRRRAIAVPFSPLWQRILGDKDATSLFSKLKRLLSLLLQLALLALLVLALGDPRAAASLVKGRNAVVLVDGSASMQATDVSPTRLEAAKSEVRKIIRGLGGADRLLIAQMDATITPLGPMSGDTYELDREVGDIHPTDTRADFPRALRFAADALRGADSPEIIVVSDGALGPAADAQGAVHLGTVRVSYVPIGGSDASKRRNVAVTEFSVRRYPLDKSRYEAMLEVTNTGEAPEDVEVSLLGDGQLVDLTRLRLQPGERLPRFYPNLSGASRTLEAKIALAGGVRDDLPVDDHAYALLPERRRAKVLVVSDGNLYLQAALLLDEYLDVTMVTPAQYARTYAAGGPAEDVVVFDRVTPAQPPKAHALYLDPRGTGSPVRVGAEIARPGFDKIDRKHPLVRFLALDDVNIASAHALAGESTDKVVGASEPGGPILVAGTRASYKFVALGFDPAQSDLPLRTAWPLFLINTINWFDDEDASYLSSYRTGEVWRIPVASDAAVTHATLKDPAGATESVPIHEGRAVYMGERAGFYELSTPPPSAGEAAATTAFAANLFDEAESSIAPAKELVVDGRTAGPVQGFHVGVRREIWIYLLLLAALLSAIEWGTYHRRLTV